MKRSLVVLAGVVFTGILMCGCGKKQIEVPDKVHVGVTYYDRSDTFLGEMLTCFREELEQVDIEASVTIRDAGGSQRAQNDQVEEMIDAGCNVLCVNLVDRADPSEVIDLAREHDVPIIFFNREPVEEDMMQWDGIYYVGAVAKQAGVIQGELAMDVIEKGMVDRNRDGKIQYVILEGEVDHQDALIRTEMVVNTLKVNNIGLEKLSCQIANWNRAQAQNRMEQMIGQYQNQIELVLANNDDMALGAYDAYKKLNYTQDNLPVFLGIDGTQTGLTAVSDSILAGTVYNDKEGQAEAMAKLSVAIVTGRGMDELELENGKYIYLSYKRVTKENVNLFLNEH